MWNSLGFLVIVVINVAIWPMSLWTTKKGARPEVNGLMISSIACLLSMICVIGTNKWGLITGELLVLGGITGIAYSIGFCIFIFNCLKIGPSGLTTMINNLGLIGAIIAGVVLDRPGITEMTLILTGLMLIVVSLAIINKSKGSDAKISRKWLVYVGIGGGFSVISFLCNALAGRQYPDASFVFTMITNGTSMLILLCYSCYKKCRKPNKYEVMNGCFVGGTGVLGGVITFTLLKTLSPVIIYPVVTVTPIIVMLLIGHMFLGERLTKKILAGAVLGVVGITILSFYQ